MNSQRKLSIITTWYPPVNGNFIERFAQDFSKYYQVHVYVAFNHGFEKVVSSMENNVNVHRIFFPYLPRRTKFLMDYWIKKFTDKIVQLSANHDIIHAHNYYGGFVAKALAQQLNLKFILTLHSTEIQDNTITRLKKVYLQDSLDQSKHTITVGLKLKEILEENYDTTAILVPNYVDTKKFEFKNSKSRDTFRLIMIGALDKRKGIKEVLQAIKTLTERKIELHLVGNIDLRHLQKSELHQKNIIRHGRIDNDKLSDILNRCHALVSFSNVETFGITVIEAMACGLPILFCKSGGPEYIVPDFAGVKVERNIESLSEGIVKMIENYNSFDSLKIRDFVVKNYGKDAVEKTLLNIYSD